jgi:hypothetical protein
MILHHNQLLLNNIKSYPSFKPIYFDLFSDNLVVELFWQSFVIQSAERSNSSWKFFKIGKFLIKSMQINLFKTKFPDLSHLKPVLLIHLHLQNQYLLMFQTYIHQQKLPKPNKSCNRSWAWGKHGTPYFPSTLLLWTHNHRQKCRMN